VGSGVTLTLKNITLKGLKNGDDSDNIDNNAAVITVNAGGKLVLENGAVITDNKTIIFWPVNPNGGNGGGVEVNGGTFAMYGGTISGNTGSFGGGVFVSTTGTFTMSGGTISGNTGNYGGGVYVNLSGNIGKFAKTGGIIYGSNESEGSTKNTSNASYGHAVLAYAGNQINTSLRRDNTSDESHTIYRNYPGQSDAGFDGM
jgi:hypothetical protein